MMFGLYARYFVLILLLIIKLKNCQSSSSVCKPNPCLNGGICSLEIHPVSLTPNHGYLCTCPHGYKGLRCEENIDDCKNKPCLNGGKCIDQANSRYECKCKTGFIGIECEYPDPCYNKQPCLNNGVCHPLQNGEYQCQCNGYYGDRCQNRIKGNFCPTELKRRREMCSNRGICVDSMPVNPMVPNIMSCRCDQGFQGTYCLDIVDSILPICKDDFCRNGGYCINVKSSPKCICPSQYKGKHCEISKLSESKALNMIQNCSKTAPECSIKIGNGICDQQCNTKACNFDGGDCDPWRHCRSKQYDHCRHVFNDGKCDPECNTVECLFDGTDCQRSECQSQQMCSKVYQNGICDKECNNPQCGFDGGDCNPSTDKQSLNKNSTIDSNTNPNDISFYNAEINRYSCSNNDENEGKVSGDGGDKRNDRNNDAGVIRDFFIDIIVNTTIEKFNKQKKEFLQRLSAHLKMVLYIKSVQLVQNTNGDNVAVRLAISPSECLIHGGQCFSSLKQISDFLKASIEGDHPISLPFKLESVKTRMETKFGPKKPNNKMNYLYTLIIGGVIFVCCCVISVCVLTRNNWNSNRCRVKTKGIWIPNEGGVVGGGYSTSSSSLGSVAWPSTMYPNNNNNHQVTQMTMQGYKGINKTGFNDLLWNNHNNNRKRKYESINNSNNNNNNNTNNNSINDPALIASFEAISNALQISDGIHQFVGPQQNRLMQLINNCATKVSSNITDSKLKTNTNLGHFVNENGESLLHIAARMNAGSIIIKRLHILWPDMLNSLDEWGRTPLTTAVASDAIDSAECLVILEKQRRKELKQQNKMKNEQLNNNNNNNNNNNLEKLNLTQKSSIENDDEGKPTTTALIEALKSGADEMVFLLLEEGTSVSAVDILGRNGVHWAAMMDNVTVLQRLGKAKAFQRLIESRDNEEKTPLCLAAQEGAMDSAMYMADATVRLYTNKSAQKGIDANNDQGPFGDAGSPCPIEIAMENGHLEIAEAIKKKFSKFTPAKNSSKSTLSSSPSKSLTKTMHHSSSSSSTTSYCLKQQKLDPIHEDKTQDTFNTTELLEDGEENANNCHNDDDDVDNGFDVDLSKLEDEDETSNLLIQSPTETIKQVFSYDKDELDSFKRDEDSQQYRQQQRPDSNNRPYNMTPIAKSTNSSSEMSPPFPNNLICSNDHPCNQSSSASSASSGHFNQRIDFPPPPPSTQNPHTQQNNEQIYHHYLEDVKRDIIKTPPIPPHIRSYPSNYYPYTSSYYPQHVQYQHNHISQPHNQQHHQQQLNYATYYYNNNNSNNNNNNVQPYHSQQQNPNLTAYKQNPHNNIPTQYPQVYPALDVLL